MADKKHNEFMDCQITKTKEYLRKFSDHRNYLLNEEDIFIMSQDITRMNVVDAVKFATNSNPFGIRL